MKGGFNMKKLLTLAILTTFAIPVSVSAVGMPAAHGADGRTFGGLVSDLAQENTMALVEHVSGRTLEQENKGMPAAHGVDGRDFGGAVSGLARTNPSGLASHVSGR